MIIKLYNNKSDVNVVTKDVIEVASFNGTLRDDCSIIDPVIKFENFNRSLVNQCNYALIEQFGRYYFIKDILFKGNLTEISMHVDVLASWQTQLKSLEAVISRQEYKYNLYLQDGYFKTYQNPHVSIKQFPSGFNTQQFVLAVAGGGGYTPTPASE